jgi:hypothetical protein
MELKPIQTEKEHREALAQVVRQTIRQELHAA